MSLSQEERLARRKENRMAGDALNEGTKESADASEALSQSERNKQTRERIGNNPERLAERIGVVDRDKYDVSGFSDKEINMALQGSKFDKNDYARLTGKPIGGGGGGGDDDNSTPTPTPETEVAPPSNGGGGGDGPTQTINPPGLMPGIPTDGGMGINFNQTQDNDQSIVNNGSNNTNNNTADNSNTFNQSSAAGFSKDWMNKYFNFGG